jgi:predicted unusual protein kinase regulating ubiquinone biosynthesis (AarF/ABC1/UbiB family)
MDLVRVAGQNGLRVPAELSLLGKTLLNLESVVRILDPTFRPADAVRRHALLLVGGRMLDEANPSSLLRKGLEMKRFAEDLPGRIDTILETIGEGHFRVAVEIKGEERIVEALTRVANRVTQGIVLAALVIGASLLMRVQTNFTILGYPGLAIVLFVLAVVGAAHLLWKIGYRSAPDHHTP